MKYGLILHVSYTLVNFKKLTVRSIKSSFGHGFDSEGRLYRNVYDKIG